MEMMNGSVQAESTPGEGSCFSIELPLANAKSDTSSLAEDFEKP
jgi:signal transduction histidine kinase